MKDENSSTDQDNYTIFCSSSLILDPNVSDEEKITFLTISIILRRSGYAICTDKWLAEKRSCSEDTIQRHLKSLEEKRYIVIENFDDGFAYSRRIWLADEYALYLAKNGNAVEQTYLMESSYEA